MWNESLSRAHVYIANIHTSNEDIHTIFVKLENALKQKEDMRQARDQFQKDVHNLRVDVMLLRQAASIMQGERENTNNCVQILESTFNHLLEIISFLDDDRIKNMLRFTILRKQHEVQVKLNFIEEQQNNDLEFKVAMERRKIVKGFRKCQFLLKDVKESGLIIELENQQLDHKWKAKIWRAKQKLNKKIVSLVQIWKKITDVYTGRDCMNSGIVLRARSGPIALQSAFEFLKKYPKVPCGVAEKLNFENPNIKNMSPRLRSILMVNRPQEASQETISPTKQVHFAPLPCSSNFDEASFISLEALIPEIDEHLLTNILDPELSQMEKENEPIVSDLPDRAIVEMVEVLPRLGSTFENHSDASVSSYISKTNIPRNYMSKLSFKNVFSFNESLQEHNSVKKVKHKCNPQQKTFTMLQNSFQSSHQSTDNDSGSNNVIDLNTWNFSTPIDGTNDDFFLNFIDGNSTEPQDNGRSYDL